MPRGRENRKRFLEAVAEAERSPDTGGMVLALYAARKGGPHETHCAATGAIQKMRAIENVTFHLMEALYGENADGGSDA